MIWESCRRAEEMTIAVVPRPPEVLLEAGSLHTVLFGELHES